jgi:hypothetical protein
VCVCPLFGEEALLSVLLNLQIQLQESKMDIKEMGYDNSSLMQLCQVLHIISNIKHWVLLQESVN